MSEAALALPRLFLQPAEAVVADTPTMVHTVLGSCVAITLRAPRLGLAAIVHCVLPASGAPAATLSTSEAVKYVDTAAEMLLQILARRGVLQTEIEVKLFGGADNMGLDGYRVGARNVEAALAAFAERGMPVAASDVGGRHGRTIDFDTTTGEVQVRRLPLRHHRGKL
jgi:chemotaxis protein CheD